MPMMVAKAHAVIVSMASVMITLGISLPFWVKHINVTGICRSEGYSGLWVSCAKHCIIDRTLTIENQNKTPLNLDIDTCQDKEYCYDFAENDITIKEQLKTVRIVACVAAFLSFVSVGFGLVRIVRWGLLAKRILTWILALFSLGSGVAGILVFQWFLTQTVKTEDKVSLKIDHYGSAAIMFLLASCLNCFDCIVLLTDFVYRLATQKSNKRVPPAAPLSVKDESISQSQAS